jgi:hypothetical protein
VTFVYVVIDIYRSSKFIDKTNESTRRQAHNLQ